jgi:hypothetical protein
MRECPVFHGVHERLRALDVEDDRLAAPGPGQHVARVEDQDVVAPDDPAAPVHHADPVGIPIERHPQLGPGAPHRRDQVLQVLRDGGIGVVIGEGAVALGEQPGPLDPQGREQLRGHQRAGAVAAIVDHPQRRPVGVPHRPDARGDVGHVPVDDRRLAHGAGAGGEVRRHDQPVQLLDLLPVQRGRADAHLEAVVLGRIVRPGDLDPRHHRLMVEGPVQQRRGHDAHVDDIDATPGQPGDQRLTQHLAAGAVVAPHRHRAPDSPVAQQRRDPAPQPLGHFGGEVAAHDAAHVVLAEDGRADRHGVVG